MDNIKQATKKSIYENNVAKLDNLGSGKGDFAMADMFNAAENNVADFIERVKKNIQSEDMIVTGGIDDIRMEITDAGINIIGSEHLIYQDAGVNGAEVKKYDTPFSYSDKRPPALAFRTWIDTKNIQLRNEEDYGGNPSPFEDFSKEKEKNSLAYAIATKVFKEGFKPRNIFKVEIPELVEDLKKTLGDFSKEMITSGIRNKYGGDIYKRK